MSIVENKQARGRLRNKQAIPANEDKNDDNSNNKMMSTGTTTLAAAPKLGSLLASLLLAALPLASLATSLDGLVRQSISPSSPGGVRASDNTLDNALDALQQHLRLMRTSQRAQQQESAFGARQLQDLTSNDDAVRVVFVSNAQPTAARFDDNSYALDTATGYLLAQSPLAARLAAGSKSEGVAAAASVAKREYTKPCGFNAVSCPKYRLRFVEGSRF